MTLWFTLAVGAIIGIVIIYGAKTALQIERDLN